MFIWVYEKNPDMTRMSFEGIQNITNICKSIMYRQGTQIETRKKDSELLLDSTSKVLWTDGIVSKRIDKN